ncbi:hypothetical protein MKZ01_14005 [Lysinibacillus endophyticus]|uniref:hypothetical protein n=1 Tax=Ureibacillus endophyticus TaxID=1978490 RepID=UPI003134E87B
MIIEISEISQMQYEKFLRFKMIGSANSVFNIHFPDIIDMDTETIRIWMSNINAFPIYFCIQITDSFTRDFEFTCNTNSVKFKYIGEYDGSKIAIFEILDSESFSVIFPFINLISSMEDLVFWSIKKNCFTVDKMRRQRGVFDLIPVNINFDVETTVFSLTQSGLMLEVYSNSSLFNSYQDVVISLPDFLIPIELKE